MTHPSSPQHPLGLFQGARNCASTPSAKVKHAYSPNAAVEAGHYLQNDWNPSEISDVPYQNGLTITAFRHQPTEPFGLGYDTDKAPEHPGWKEMSQIDYCLSRPPLEGRTDLNSQKDFAITSIIRTGQQEGAQIVVVDDTMVAKIYDPLYYRAVNEYGGQNDIVSDADEDYCREAAAYEGLQKSPEALSVIPAYYGTWTIDVVTSVMRSPHKKVKYTRSVRMILMERLSGDCMVNVDPSSLREEVRSVIVKKAIIAETLIRAAGVNHRDVATRNIMILGTDHKNPDIAVNDIHLEVKLFDFNIAIVTTHPRFNRCKYHDNLKALQTNWPSKLLFPIVTHWGGMQEFAATGWCPDGFRVPEQWLWQHFHDDDRYIPVIQDPNKLSKRPVHQETPNTQHDIESSSDSGIDVSSDSKKGTDSCNGSSPDDAKTGEDKRQKLTPTSILIITNQQEIPSRIRVAQWRFRCNANTVNVWVELGIFKEFTGWIKIPRAITRCFRQFLL
jgi:hypothetical protein